MMNINIIIVTMIIVRSEERPLTFSKAKGGLVPKVLEAEVEVEKQQEGVGQGEQGKLLLEVRLALINQS